MATARRDIQRAIQFRVPSIAKPASLTTPGRIDAGSFSRDPSPFSRRAELSAESSAYREFVAMAAYYRAERRGFAPGHELDDWLEAEREVAAKLNSQG